MWSHKLNVFKFQHLSPTLQLHAIKYPFLCCTFWRVESIARMPAAKCWFETSLSCPLLYAWFKSISRNGNWISLVFYCVSQSKICRPLLCCSPIPVILHIWSAQRNSFQIYIEYQQITKALLKCHYMGANLWEWGTM